MTQYVILIIDSMIKGYRQQYNDRSINNTIQQEARYKPVIAISSSSSTITLPDRNWPGKYRRLELSNIIRNLVNFRSWYAILTVNCQYTLHCTVGLEGGSRRHSTVRQPDSQGSQTVFLVAPCCSDLTVVYANDVLVYGLTLTRPRFDEDW